MKMFYCSSTLVRATTRKSDLSLPSLRTQCICWWTNTWNASSDHPSNQYISHHSSKWKLIFRFLSTGHCTVRSHYRWSELASLSNERAEESIDVSIFSYTISCVWKQNKLYLSLIKVDIWCFWDRFDSRSIIWSFLHFKTFFPKSPKIPPCFSTSGIIIQNLIRK